MEGDPDRGGRRPNLLALEPSSGDKAEAIQRGIDARVSVWDERRTSVQRALEFHGGVVQAFKFTVQDIVDTAEERGRPGVNVLVDLYGQSLNEQGRCGHSAIVGLARSSREDRAPRQLFLRALATKLRPANDR